MRMAAMTLALAACAPAAEGPPPEYLGYRAEVMGDGLVNFDLSLDGAPGPALLEDYARCAAARYATDRGFGFARHVRTLVGKRSGIWRADAIYTITAALPRGIDTIDAEVVARDCDERGVPVS
jgi:hypothetical protein